jgi:hypothetical protein
MERDNSGQVSATCNLEEVREGTKIIWERCCEDLDIHATRDGHAVSLRQTLEMELLRYLQTGSSRAPRTNSEGKERTKTPAVIEKRTVSKKEEDPGANSSSAASAGPCPYPEKWQDRFTVKFTWDSRTLGKKMHQTEGMLLIIPHGQEGRLYCQSALRIRTVIVYTGKDSQELVQANFSQIIEELEDLLEHGLRYTAKKDTF